MNKKCARPECGKTVYPLEEIKCLDKTWHKGCFKCAVCGMALSMKNYKGYNKTPYCEAHYPKTVATVVGDTPEMRRLAENTKIQSQAHYHADFEKMKGTKITVADDPEMKRHLQNTKVVSQVEYHGEADRRQHMEKTRPPLEESLNRVDGSSLGQGGSTYVDARPPSLHNGGGGERTGFGQGDSPYSARTNAGPTLIYSSEAGGKVNPGPQRHVGSLDDYDPLNGQWGTVGQSNVRQQLSANLAKQAAQSPHNGSPRSPAHAQAQQPQQLSPQAQKAALPAGGPRTTAGGGPYYRAMYDYTAADTDEVSFVEGDVIGDCQFVDEGWMTGTVQRTKGWGMLPANYVEKIM